MGTSSMTDAEHRKEATRLQRAITRRRNERKLMPTLAEKIEAGRQIKQLEDQLHQHRLNYFDLVQA